MALDVLRRNRIPAENARSKSWDEFATPDAPALDYVITVCGNAAGEACPIWPGRPTTAHWGVDDPAARQGTEPEKLRAFRDAYRILERRILSFTSLDLESLDPLALQREIRAIGEA